ncbi:MAG: enhanced serine sensitivity protein SseB C-terminal domain-containing protein [Nibricoccus sp.]
MNNEVTFENTLERLLTEAAESPAARPQFYRELLNSTVLICPHGDIEESDDPEKKTATLKLEAATVDGVNYIRFYLSEKFLPPAARYISLPARQFFEITKGSHLVFNPGAKVLKTFSPDEVDRLLSGQLLQPEKEFQVNKSAKISIGQPKTVPDRLLAELSKYFSNEGSVLRAWLGWYHNPETENEPGYLLAIETTRSTDFKTLAGVVSLILKETGTEGHYCDIVQYTGRDLTGYFRSDRPFYSKPLLRRLWGAVGG